MTIIHARGLRVAASITLLALFAPGPFAAAQDAATPASGATEAATPQEIVIGEISWDVDGRTREWALRHAAEIKGNERFSDRAAFDLWVAERRQMLYNERALANVEIETTVGSPDASGVARADLLIRVKDTWNVVALPYPKYDTNDGLILSIKARDYNFLGTLEPLRLDFRYELDPDSFRAADFGMGAFIMEIDSTTPFRAAGLDWELDFDHYFAYTNNDGFEYENTTGLAVIFPIEAFKKDTQLKVGVYHGTALNQENDDEYKPTEGDRFADYWFMSDSLRAYWTIPIRKIAGFGELDYVPRSILNYNYRPGGDIGVQRRGPTFELGHELSLGQVDWVENFRKGIDVTIDNANIYNLYDLEWIRRFDLTAVGHKPLGKFAGVSSRFVAAWYPDKPEFKAGSYLRGVVDNSVWADYAVYLNFDLPVRVIRFTPSKWWPDKKWAKIFDFEQHWSPFMDVGFLASEDTGTAFGADDAMVTAGLAVVTFPLSWRSLFVRISLGFNLRQALDEGGLPGGDGREIFVGVGHEY